MSDYTPTEDLVKTAWHQYATAADASRARLRGDDENPSDEFDRFVARVKAEAWNEGYAAGQADHDCDATNPYREEEGL